MKRLTLLLAALVAAGASTISMSCSGSNEEAAPSGVGKHASQEQTDTVTFHVIGMKKTASGAT